MSSKGTIYPLSAIRALALHRQGLAQPPKPGKRPSRNEIEAIIEQIGCVQIDTLQMVHRSQYIALWSRLGQYDRADLDGLLFDPGDCRLFEYWLHAACIIPFSQYRYRLPLMRRSREGTAGWHGRWIQKPENAALVRSILEHVRANGAVRAADFEYKRAQRGTWWDWKPAKIALEHLYDTGDLMIAGRINFQRVYDLKERVLPEWVDTAEPSQEEASLYLLERAMRSLAVCQPSQVRDYFDNVRRGDTGAFVQKLIADGVLVPIRAGLSDGEEGPLVVHRDNLTLLKQAADGALTAQRTTFLSPFDNLFWARGRDAQLWGFRQVMEAYKPEPQRIWGYFCLPILHKDRLVGRFDPKLERQTGVLRLKALYLEPGVAPDGDLVADVAAAMRGFMGFHDARDLAAERSQPRDFGKKLLKAL